MAVAVLAGTAFFGFSVLAVVDAELGFTALLVLTLVGFVVGLATADVLLTGKRDAAVGRVAVGRVTAGFVCFFAAVGAGGGLAAVLFLLRGAAIFDGGDGIDPFSAAGGDPRSVSGLAGASTLSGAPSDCVGLPGCSSDMSTFSSGAAGPGDSSPTGGLDMLSGSWPRLESGSLFDPYPSSRTGESRLLIGVSGMSSAVEHSGPFTDVENGDDASKRRHSALCRFISRGASPLQAASTSSNGSPASVLAGSSRLGLGSGDGLGLSPGSEYAISPSTGSSKSSATSISSVVSLSDAVAGDVGADTGSVGSSCSLAAADSTGPTAAAS